MSTTTARSVSVAVTEPPPAGPAACDKTPMAIGRFRTAWPLKGCIELVSEGEGLRLVCTKRVPWSSSILTFLWFSLVGFGTLGFVMTYLIQGGLDSLGSILLGIGVTGVGLIVVAFGLLTVTVAYRIENTRLMLVYGELKAIAVEHERAA